MPKIPRKSRCNNKNKTMRSIILVAAILFTFNFVKAQGVSAYILELESHTKWSAVDAGWTALRNNWVADCKAVNRAAQSASLLLTFESHVKWEAVEEKWKIRRSSWVLECKSAVTNAQVSKLLRELEANIKWSAVDDTWKNRRDAWINELKSF
jgi:hypothetical protein